MWNQPAEVNLLQANRRDIGEPTTGYRHVHETRASTHVATLTCTEIGVLDQPTIGNVDVQIRN